MALFYTIKNLSVNILEVLLRTPPKTSQERTWTKNSETQKHLVRKYRGLIHHSRKHAQLTWESNPDHFLVGSDITIEPRYRTTNLIFCLEKTFLALGIYQISLHFARE